jgi:hypothetical protein
MSHDIEMIANGDRLVVPVVNTRICRWKLTCTLLLAITALLAIDVLVGLALNKHIEEFTQCRCTSTL